MNGPGNAKESKFGTHQEAYLDNSLQLEIIETNSVTASNQKLNNFTAISTKLNLQGMVIKCHTSGHKLIVQQVRKLCVAPMLHKCLDAL